MEPTFWHDRWANNETGWHENDFNPLLTRNFRLLDLPAGSRVFVPLCGKTRDIAWLLQAGYQVAGAELSETAVQQLFAELGVSPAVTAAGKLQRYQAPGLDVFVGDIFDLTAAELGNVDATYDRAALVALPPAMRVRYAALLQRITAIAPQLVVCFVYDQTLQEGPPHSVPLAEVQEHHGAAYEVRLVETRAVPGGLKGKCPADEIVMTLTPRR